MTSQTRDPVRSLLSSLGVQWVHTFTHFTWIHLNLIFFGIVLKSNWHSDQLISCSVKVGTTFYNTFCSNTQRKLRFKEILSVVEKSGEPLFIHFPLQTNSPPPPLFISLSRSVGWHKRLCEKLQQSLILEVPAKYFPGLSITTGTRGSLVLTAACVRVDVFVDTWKS